MRILNASVAFFQASLAFVGFCGLAILFYSQMSMPYNYISAFVSLLLGIYFGRLVYNMGLSHGVLATMTGARASSELDTLEPVGSDVLKLTPKDLEERFVSGSLPFHYGSVAIWGDSNNRLLHKKHQLETIAYNAEQDLLNIVFSDGCALDIKKPGLIMCAATYLKVSKAKEVTWVIPDSVNKPAAFVYYNTGTSIQTTSNTQWSPREFDIGIGMDAVYLQG